MKIEFLNLGRQPIANNFLRKLPAENEFFFNLSAGFDEESKLVSLMDFVDKGLLFNQNYVYMSSSSNTMKYHFQETSNYIEKTYSPLKLLEIGSNDGTFLKNFKKTVAIGLEPCGNFAQVTTDMGYKTYLDFWTKEKARQILDECGQMDIIFSANCMCHIPDIEESFEAVSILLKNDGHFIFEDPALIFMINNNSYDQIYDEHAHIFSALSVINLLKKYGLYVEKIEKLPVHGGSYRYFVGKDKKNINNEVQKVLYEECLAGLDKVETFMSFGHRVEKSKLDLLEILNKEKNKGGKIVGYGATSKSIVVYNYCGIGNNLLDYVVDTTPTKYNTFCPGVHIKVIPYKELEKDITCAFLGAWNFEKEILNKEKIFLSSKGKFITHVPFVRVIDGSNYVF